MRPYSSKKTLMAYTGKTFLSAFYKTAGFFLILFAIFHLVGVLYLANIVSKASLAFKSGMQAELDFLTVQGNEVAKNKELIRYVLSGDSENLILLMQNEKTSRSIGLMGVTNEQGVVLGRTKNPEKLGDNVFLSSPVGRKVALGKTVQSVESPVGFDPRQIIISTGRPILHKGQMIGSLFANHLADDAYAVKFKNKYLPSRAEVVFYNKQGGVYGDSFANSEIRKLINSYFNTGSDWLRNGVSGKTVSFNDGSFYYIDNLIFPGLESSPGGALIFIPRVDVSHFTNSLLAFLTACFFVFIAFRHHRKSRKETRGSTYYLFLGTAFILVVALVLLALHIENIGYLRLKKIAYPLYNSTLRLQPEFGIYDVGFEQQFSVMADTGDEAINAVSVELLFDPNSIEVKEVTAGNSACAYVIENRIDTVYGKINFSCGIFQSGGERGSLEIAKIFFKPKRIGTFNLTFGREKTKVLASDGLGTDVLRMSQSGSYKVDNFENSILPNEYGSSTKHSFIVFSPSHPNQSRWYSSSVARFVWRGKPDAVYAYTFDSLADTVPSSAKTIKGQEISLPVPGDGIYYFHLSLVSGGPIVHYRVQTDTSAPIISAIHLSEDRVTVGDVVRFSFEAEDSASGVQKNYYVDLGNHLFLPIGDNLFVPFLEAGEQKVTLRVYDTAGNYAEKSQIIHVEPK